MRTKSVQAILPFFLNTQIVCSCFNRCMGLYVNGAVSCSRLTSTGLELALLLCWHCFSIGGLPQATSMSFCLPVIKMKAALAGDCHAQNKNCQLLPFNCSGPCRYTQNIPLSCCTKQNVSVTGCEFELRGCIMHQLLVTDFMENQ